MTEEFEDVDFQYFLTYVAGELNSGDEFTLKVSGKTGRFWPGVGYDVVSRRELIRDSQTIARYISNGTGCDSNSELLDDLNQETIALRDSFPGNLERTLLEVNAITAEVKHIEDDKYKINFD
jgi:hypothetical protein